MAKKFDAAASVKEKLDDIEWRLDNLYWIKDKRGKKVKFCRNTSQQNLWDNRWYLNIILKDRQRGFSTFIAILILDTCLFSKDIECGIIDITLTDAKKKLEKIKFAYDSLPESLRDEIPLTTDNKDELVWLNKSVVRVGTSHRGGTLQILHISESGKISARTPDRAREIRTGALNTIAPGCMIFNESTAEGTSGDFYEDCQNAMALRRQGTKLTKLDYRFHFFGWWMPYGNDDENEIDPEGVHISLDDKEYFDKIEKEQDTHLSRRQRAWYVKKRDQQKDDMLREYPATPEEAFKAAIDGAYLGKIMDTLYATGKITVVPHDPASPVNTGWDFGLNDRMCIWLHQRVAMQHRIIGFISGTDEDVLYYWRQLQMYPYIWGKHFLPHDGSTRRIGSAQNGEAPPRTLEEILNEAGMQNTQVVPRIGDKATAIQEVKIFLPQVWIDETSCGGKVAGEKITGIWSLQNFRREWDDKMEEWKNRPRHDKAMHGYDAFETLARGLNMYGDSVSKPKARKAAPVGDWRVM